MSNHSFIASDWINTHYCELPVNEWVAISGNGVVAHAEDLAELHKQLVDLGISLSDVTVIFVEEAGPELG